MAQIVAVESRVSGDDVLKLVRQMVRQPEKLAALAEFLEPYMVHMEVAGTTIGEGEVEVVVTFDALREQEVGAKLKSGRVVLETRCEGIVTGTLDIPVEKEWGVGEVPMTAGKVKNNVMVLTFRPH